MSTNWTAIKPVDSSNGTFTSLGVGDICSLYYDYGGQCRLFPLSDRAAPYTTETPEYDAENRMWTEADVDYQTSLDGLAVAQFMMTTIVFICLLCFVVRDMLELYSTSTNNERNVGDGADTDDINEDLHQQQQQLLQPSAVSDADDENIRNLQLQNSYPEGSLRRRRQLRQPRAVVGQQVPATRTANIGYDTGFPHSTSVRPGFGQVILSPPSMASAGTTDADLSAEPNDDDVTITARPAISTPSDLDSERPTAVRSDVINNDDQPLQDILSTAVSPMAALRPSAVVPAPVVDRLAFTATAATWDSTAMASNNAIAGSILRRPPSTPTAVFGCATERTLPSSSNAQQLQQFFAPPRQHQSRKHHKPPLLADSSDIFDSYQQDQTLTEATTVHDHRPEISDAGIIGNDGATSGTRSLLRVDRAGTSIPVDEKNADFSINPQARNDPAASADSCSDSENNLLTLRDLPTNVNNEQTTTTAYLNSDRQKSTDVIKTEAVRQRSAEVFRY